MVVIERSGRRLPVGGRDVRDAVIGLVAVGAALLLALQHGIISGVLPTLACWVRSGSHDAIEWWARVPSTTPASQAALLHGTNDGIPPFRSAQLRRVSHWISEKAPYAAELVLDHLARAA